MENPKIATAVSNTEKAVIFPVPKRSRKLSLFKLDRMVQQEINI